VLPYFDIVSAGLLLATSSLYWPAYTGLLLLRAWNDALTGSDASAIAGAAKTPVAAPSWLADSEPAHCTAERLLTSVFPNGVNL
jgi:hypothetical protein